MPIFGLLDQGLGFAERIFGPSETKAEFKGHQIAVKLTFTSIQLYVDGVAVDTAKVSLFPAKNVSLVRGAVVAGKKSHVIEVYGQSGWQPKIKICVDQEKIAGADF